MLKLNTIGCPDILCCQCIPYTKVLPKIPISVVNLLQSGNYKYKTVPTAFIDIWLREGVKGMCFFSFKNCSADYCRMRDLIFLYMQNSVKLVVDGFICG